MPDGGIPNLNPILPVQPGGNTQAIDTNAVRSAQSFGKRPSDERRGLPVGAAVTVTGLGFGKKDDVKGVWTIQGERGGKIIIAQRSGEKLETISITKKQYTRMMENNNNDRSVRRFKPMHGELSPTSHESFAPAGLPGGVRVSGFDSTSGKYLIEGKLGDKFVHKWVDAATVTSLRRKETTKALADALGVTLPTKEKSEKTKEQENKVAEEQKKEEEKSEAEKSKDEQGETMREEEEHVANEVKSSAKTERTKLEQEIKSGKSVDEASAKNLAGNISGGQISPTAESSRSIESARDELRSVRSGTNSRPMMAVSDTQADSASSSSPPASSSFSSAAPESSGGIFSPILQNAISASQGALSNISAEKTALNQERASVSDRINQLQSRGRGSVSANRADEREIAALSLKRDGLNQRALELQVGEIATRTQLDALKRAKEHPTPEIMQRLARQGLIQLPTDIGGRSGAQNDQRIGQPSRGIGGSEKAQTIIELRVPKVKPRSSVGIPFIDRSKIQKTQAPMSGAMPRLTKPLATLGAFITAQQQDRIRGENRSPDGMDALGETREQMLASDSTGMPQPLLQTRVRRQPSYAAPSETTGGDDEEEEDLADGEQTRNQLFREQQTDMARSRESLLPTRGPEEPEEEEAPMPEEMPLDQGYDDEEEVSEPQSVSGGQQPISEEEPEEDAVPENQEQKKNASGSFINKAWEFIIILLIPELKFIKRYVPQTSFIPVKKKISSTDFLKIFGSLLLRVLWPILLILLPAVGVFIVLGVFLKK